MRVGRRKQFAHGQHIRGDDAAEAKAEHGRDGEEPGLALGGQETDHSYELANGAGEDRTQAADPVGDKARNLPAQKSTTEQLESITAPTDAEIRHRCGASTGLCS